MKESIFLLMLICLLAGSALSQDLRSGKLGDPWTKKDLLEPAILAASIAKAAGPRPFIFNIGVVEDIPGARNIGGASNEENLDKFTNALKALPKDSKVVVYCGCCPFYKCPNIRPAFNAMKAAGFKNGKLLNLATSIKVDWIEKGYPIKSK